MVRVRLLVDDLRRNGRRLGRPVDEMVDWWVNDMVDEPCRTACMQVQENPLYMAMEYLVRFRQEEV